MANLSEILSHPAAKALIVVVAVAAIGGAAYEATTSSAFKSNDYGKQVSPSVVVADNQTAIEALKTNKALPDSVKKQEIQHLQSQIDAANGNAPKASGPPTPKTAGSS